MLWLLVLIIISISINFSPVSAQEDFIVTVGQDKVFTEFNYHDSWFESDPNNPEPWPIEREAYSESNVARVSLSATPGHAGVAQAWTGIQFEWNLGQYTWEQVKDWPVNVTVDFSYQISASWVDGYGSANAGVTIPYFNQFYIDFIGRETGQSGSRSDTISKTYTVPVSYLDSINRKIYLDTYCQAHSVYKEDEEGNPIGITHYSSAEAQIKSIKIEFKPDISVSMDYKRDLKDYKTKDDKTVYGADSVIYTIIVTNQGSEDATAVVVNDLLPLGLKFISADPQGVYDPTTGMWNVGKLVAGASAKLTLKTKVIQSGEIINKATLNEDSNPSNNEAKATFNARNPVILVHGFKSNPDTWDTLSRRLKSEGIRHYIFDYSPGLQDPYFVAGNFNNWVNGYLRDEAYIGYQGKFDIVSHSMGALVTRFWMEGNSANAGNIGQWIGIGPVNHGAAIADILVDPTVAPEIYNQINKNVLRKIIIKILPTDSDAVRNMITTDPQILALNSDGIAPGVFYRVIMGTDVKFLGTDTVAKINDNYQFTTEGDGIVANVQSMLIGSATTDYFRVNHIDLPNNRDVINRVVTYLKNN